MIVQRAIRQAGYRGLMIEEADNGAQALEKLRGQKPLLILSDWNMPEMSGLDLLTKIREEQSHVPFGFITSETSKGIRELAMSSGATFLICKPFTPDDIQVALSPILGGS